MENGNLSNLEQINNLQLKQYLSQHRNDRERGRRLVAISNRGVDDAAFSEALAILMSRRDLSATRYSGNMTLEEIERVIKDKLDEAREDK